MTLMLLAVSAAITLCVVAYIFAIYALPFMVGLAAVRFAYAAHAGHLFSGVAGIGAAALSITLVIAVLALAKHPALRLAALAIFAVPAAVAGYVLVYGVTCNVIASKIVLHLLCGAGGLFVAISAMMNLNRVAMTITSR